MFKKQIMKDYGINLFSIIKIIVCVVMTFMYAGAIYSIFQNYNPIYFDLFLTFIFLLYIYSIIQIKSFEKILVIYFLGTLLFSLLQINLYLMMVLNICCIGITHKSKINLIRPLNVIYIMANIILYSILCPIWLAVLI